VVPHSTVSRNHNHVRHVFGQQWKNLRLRSIVHKQQTHGFISELEFGTSYDQTVVFGFPQHPAQGSDGTVRVGRTSGERCHFDKPIPDLIHANVFQFCASQKIPALAVILPGAFRDSLAILNPIQKFWRKNLESRGLAD
jgi:hypothetical protein